MSHDGLEDYRKFERENYVPFHQKLMVLEPVCSAGKLCVVSSYEGDVLAGILPYYLKKKLTYSYITHPPMIKWMGPMISENCSNKTEVLLDLLRQLPNAAYFEQNFSYDIAKEELPQTWANDFHEQYSYRIDGLQDLERLFKAIYPDYRNNKIKKAKEILHVSREGTIDEFLAVHHQSFTRQGIEFPVSEQALKKHIENILEQKMATFLFARDNSSNIHSVALVTWDEKVAYLHMAGDDIDLRKSGSGIFITWEAIKFASEQLGLSSFDFEGSMLPNVERVRKRFGAERKYYGKIKQYNSRSFKLLQTLKK